MLVPPIMVVGFDTAAADALTRLLAQIGLANPPLVSALPVEAMAFLSDCATSRLPVIVLAAGTNNDTAHAPGRVSQSGLDDPISPRLSDGLAVIEWMRQQPDAIASIDAIALIDETDNETRLRAEQLGVATVHQPPEMRPLISALKALALPEKARIDPATLTVQVELLRRGGLVSRQ